MMPPRKVLECPFWAKRVGKHGSGKFHYWKQLKEPVCGGGPDKPTVNRREKRPYLYCHRCEEVLLRPVIEQPTPAVQ